MVVNHWYIGEAERHGNRYLLTHAAADLVLFGGRLILAHNKILYPFHKWFMYELAHAPEQPADLVAQAESLLREPSKETAGRFYESITGFRDWGLTEQVAFRHWDEDYEWPGAPRARPWPIGKPGHRRPARRRGRCRHATCPLRR